MMGPTVDIKQSTILQTLHLLLPGIHQRLRDGRAWRGIQVREPSRSFTYQRLVCVDSIVSTGRSSRTWMLGVHYFPSNNIAGVLHNHRYPTAVYALDAAGTAGAALYEMPWEHRRSGQAVASGQICISSGQSYAMEPCLEVFHAIHSLRPHVSITLSDITGPPARPNRLDVQPLSMVQTWWAHRRILRAVTQGLTTHRGE